MLPAPMSSQSGARPRGFAALSLAIAESTGKDADRPIISRPPEGERLIWRARRSLRLLNALAVSIASTDDFARPPLSLSLRPVRAPSRLPAHRASWLYCSIICLNQRSFHDLIPHNHQACPRNAHGAFCSTVHARFFSERAEYTKLRNQTTIAFCNCLLTI